MKKITLGVFTLLLGIVMVSSASAASTIVVTSSNTQGWSTADTNAGGSVNYVLDATAPAGEGALQLTTDSTNEARAQYLHGATGLLSAITELSYSTKQVSGPAHAAPSYQLLVDLNGAGEGGFTTLVYEPYWNGVVVNGTWQSWDVDAGQFWSSRTFTDGADCSVTAGAGGAPFYTLADLQADCPDAVVLGFGVNVGTYNPNYDVYTDLVSLNETAYDFEVSNPALAAEDFGVVDYDTGATGQLSGYTAGFGLTDATLDDVESVVVTLYSGATLLQTNTATTKFHDEINGTQFSSPFDVSGDFDYELDGYWDNDREAEYGQSLPATRVVATITLENGDVLIAENTNLVGDPTTIYPENPPAPSQKDECKYGGWMTLTDADGNEFKNQGQCVSYFAMMESEDDESEE